MLKHNGYSIVFQEVPDEITIAIELTSCPHRCAECHSPWLRDDIGTPLTPTELMEIVGKYKNATCVCFMGGDAQHGYVAYLADIVHENTSMKTAMYSGDSEIDPELVKCLDYYKVGPYDKEAGPLDSPTTNQRMYKVVDGGLEDITYRFRERKGGILL